MSALAVAALVLVCVWLGALTLVAVLLVRQVGLLTVRLSVAGEAMAMSLDDDGPKVGSRLPDDVASVMPEEDQSYLLLISAGCDPCRELAAELDGRSFERPVVALVPGLEEQASSLATLLPPDTRVVLDPEATHLAESLDLESTPFAIEVEGATVSRKVHLHGGASALIEFMQAGSHLEHKRSFVEFMEKEATEGR